MSENNNMNDSFERFFQKKAVEGEYDIIYNEADWEKLEGRLDILDKQRAIAKRRFLAGAALFLIFSLMGYFTYSNYMKINRLEEQLSIRSLQAVPENPDSGVRQNNDNPVLGELEGTIAENSTENDRETSQPSTSKNVLESESDETEVVVDEKAEFSVTEYESKKLFIADLSNSKLALSSFNQQPIEDLKAIETAETSETAPVFASRVDDSSNDVPLNAETGNAFPRFSVGFSMAPDFSTAGSFSDFYDPGYKFGAYVEYHFTPDLAISAGIIHSTVRYTAQGNEYRPPEGYWTNGIIPVETLAECILLDIPITLKYNFLHLDRSRFYTTAGISSYIMLNEEYQFDYYGNENGLAQNWSGKTGTRHWASNAAFSIGFEYDINATLSLRAEPFVRIPLKEVGWGNVKLYSLGSFISLNYKFD